MNFNITNHDQLISPSTESMVGNIVTTENEPSPSNQLKNYPHNASTGDIRDEKILHIGDASPYVNSSTPMDDSQFRDTPTQPNQQRSGLPQATSMVDLQSQEMSG